jgi:hypothetical protein
VIAPLEFRDEICLDATKSTDRQSSYKQFLPSLEPSTHAAPFRKHERGRVGARTHLHRVHLTTACPSRISRLAIAQQIHPAIPSSPGKVGAEAPTLRHFPSAIVRGMKTLIAFIPGPMEILIVGCIAAIVAVVKIIRRP